MKKKYNDAWKVNEPCPACQGKGSDPHDYSRPCPTCQGFRLIPKDQVKYHENNV